MNGTSAIGVGAVATVAPEWSIAGSGDFNGDGKADLVWRHSSGMVHVWFMNGTSAIGVGAVATVAPEWSIAGSGDFNGDRKADILWRHS
jgi:hypothetical protein